MKIALIGKERYNPTVVKLIEDKGHSVVDVTDRLLKNRNDYSWIKEVAVVLFSYNIDVDYSPYVYYLRFQTLVRVIDEIKKSQSRVNIVFMSFGFVFGRNQGQDIKETALYPTPEESANPLVHLYCCCEHYLKMSGLSGSIIRVTETFGAEMASNSILQSYYDRIETTNEFDYIVSDSTEIPVVSVKILCDFIALKCLELNKHLECYNAVEGFISMRDFGSIVRKHCSDLGLDVSFISGNDLVNLTPAIGYGEFTEWAEVHRNGFTVLESLSLFTHRYLKQIAWKNKNFENRHTLEH